MENDITQDYIIKNYIINSEIYKSYEPCEIKT